MQIPISIGNASVKPSDLVFSNEDGIVFVATERAAVVIKAAIDRSSIDEGHEERLRRGETLKQVFA